LTTGEENPEVKTPLIDGRFFVMHFVVKEIFKLDSRKIKTGDKTAAFIFMRSISSKRSSFRKELLSEKRLD
jgi:hypothetical protein